MLGYFPDPRADELLFGVCGRLAHRLQFQSQRAVLETLFGSRDYTVVIDLPHALGTLVQNLPPNTYHTVDRLIDNHTLFPFYAPFLPPAWRASLRAEMADVKATGVKERLRLAHSRGWLSDRLRFCALCISEDLDQWGEAYWYRSHQILGVEVCTKHEVLLESSLVAPQRPYSSDAFVLAEDAAQGAKLHRIHGKRGCDPVLLGLAQDVEWLLNHPDLTESADNLHLRYQQLLSTRGLATHKGTIRRQDLVAAFLDFYPSHLLRQLRCEIEDPASHNWLVRLVGAPQAAQPPIQHLLLMRFLGETVESFFQGPPPTVRPPFGEGPWPCLNRASNHYGQLRVPVCKITYSEQRNTPPLGEFACECGFTYRRSGPDQSDADRFRVGYMVSYGEEWELRLRALWASGKGSMRAIGRHLGVDRATVKRQAQRIGLLPVVEQGAESAATSAGTNEQGAKREEYRGVWLAMLQEHPDATITQVQTIVPRVHKWLYRYDEEWLDAHKPLRRKRAPEVRERAARVDWRQRDADLAGGLQKAAARLRKVDTFPERITATRLLKEAGCATWLRASLSKLPQCMEVLDKEAETVEEVAVRRLHWVAHRYVEEGVCPAESQLISRAKIQRHLASPVVAEAIRDAFTSLTTRMTAETKVGAA